MRWQFGTIASSIVMAWLGTAAADDLQLTRITTSGVDTLIAYERGWDGNCNPVPVTVTFTKMPSHGIVSVVQGTSTIPDSTARHGSTGKCAGRTITGNQLMYRSEAGFYGSDSISYNVVNNGVSAGSTTITINVQMAANVQPPAVPPAAAQSAPVAAPQANAASGVLGAVAVGACDRLGYATGYGNIEQAKAAAMQACAGSGDNSCKVILSIQGDCAAFAVAGTCGSRGWANGVDRRQAEQGALAGCAAHGGNGCTVRRSICNGQD